jgi:hypothetical protein
MAATSTTTHSAESASRTAGAGRKDTAGPDEEPRSATATETPAAEGGPDMMQTMSRMIYSGAYALAYGVVYATVFVAQSLPQENPVMHGFRDGGRAAMDELGGG